MPRGGARKGAGRPKGKEPTKAIRLPVNLIAEIEKGNFQQLPLYLSKVSAGSPSLGEADIAEKINLNSYLVKNPTATFLVRANGQSMINAGIDENDILIVDRSIQPTIGKIVVASVDGLLTVKRLQKNNGNQLTLAAENPDFPSIEIRDDHSVVILGVVTNVIHSV